MNVLDYNSQLENYANIKTRIVLDHNDIFADKQKNPTLNIIHINIRSLNKNYDSLLILLESIKTKFDIIVLSETWKVNNLEYFNILGYEIFYSEACHNQNDGLLMYVSNNIIAKFTVQKFSENTFTNLTFKKNGMQFNIIAVYRLPSTDGNIFLHELQNILLQNKQKNAINIFLGDINIDLNKKQDNLTNEYINTIAEHGFLSYINSPTRVSNENETCIDHCFINIPSNITHKIKIIPIVLNMILRTTILLL